MSIYRMLRLTALLALLRRYRTRVARMLFAVSFALVTSWLYADVASFVAAHYPHWSGVALIAKTAVVYIALFVCCWEISRMLRGDASPAVAPGPATAKSPLEALAEKPRLRSRREDILAKPAKRD